MTPASDIEVALLDADGRIVCVNGAWSRFCADNGGDADRCGVGTSYLEVCDRTPDDVMATLVGGAVRSALQGELPAPLAVEVPCHSTGELRWFDVLVSSRLDDDATCRGATVTLSLSRSVSWPSPAATTGTRPARGPGPGAPAPSWSREPVSTERLGDGVAHAAFAVAPCAILLADDAGRVLAVNPQADGLFGVGPGGLVGRPLDTLLPGRWRGTAATGSTRAPTAWDEAPYSGRTGVAFRPGGGQVDVHLASAPVPLSCGTGALVAVSAVPLATGPVTHVAGGLLFELDTAMRRIFSAGLTLASVRSRLVPGSVPAQAIGEVMTELDRAAREVRRAGLPRPLQSGRPSSDG